MGHFGETDRKVDKDKSFRACRPREVLFRFYFASTWKPVCWTSPWAVSSDQEPGPVLLGTLLRLANCLYIWDCG